MCSIISFPKLNFSFQSGGGPERALDHRGGAEGEGAERAAVQAQARPPAQQHLQVRAQAVDVSEVDSGEGIVSGTWPNAGGRGNGPEKSFHHHTSGKLDKEEHCKRI